MTRYSSESRKGILSDQSRINEMEYFQSIYPQNLKILQRYVEEECDRLDYKGSPIYDEYPDMQVIRQVCKKICSNIPAFGETWENTDGADAEQVEIYEVSAENADRGMSQQQLSWNFGPGSQPGPWNPPPGPGRPPGPPSGPPPGPWNPPPGPGRPPGPPPGPWNPPPGPGRPPGPWNPPPGPGRPPGPPPGPWNPPPGPGRPPGPPPGRPPQRPPSSPGGWLGDMIQVLLMNEIQKRRCRTGRC